MRAIAIDIPSPPTPEDIQIGRAAIRVKADALGMKNYNVRVIHAWDPVGNCVVDRVDAVEELLPA